MLRDLQNALIHILFSEDPMTTLQEEARKLTEEDRHRLQFLTEDGVRFTEMIIQKLRFERICRGNQDMTQRFLENQEEFMNAFQDYTKEIPPSYFPSEEAPAFDAFLLKKKKDSRNREQPLG